MEEKVDNGSNVEAKTIVIELLSYIKDKNDLIGKYTTDIKERDQFIYFLETENDLLRGKIVEIEEMLSSSTPTHKKLQDVCAFVKKIRRDIDADVEETKDRCHVG